MHSLRERMTEGTSLYRPDRSRVGGRKATSNAIIRERMATAARQLNPTGRTYQPHAHRGCHTWHRSTIAGGGGDPTGPASAILPQYVTS